MATCDRYETYTVGRTAHPLFRRWDARVEAADEVGPADRPDRVGCYAVAGNARGHQEAALAKGDHCT